MGAMASVKTFQDEFNLIIPSQIFCHFSSQGARTRFDEWVQSVVRSLLTATNTVGRQLMVPEMKFVLFLGAVMTGGIMFESSGLIKAP